MKNLYHILADYKQENYYPMHMPGHKRNLDLVFNPYDFDITEIEGFDNLHDAQGILKDAMERAAHVYNSEESFFLVNGSTVGILAGIASCVTKGDRVLVARNCHKAVYNAVILNELQPEYIYPQNEPNFGINGGISADDVRKMLITYPDIKLVIITSPTFEGIISDIEKISEIVHKFGIPLLVDEAHGAHLGFHTYFPDNSISKGADIVIHSVHKTLPAFTQTALLHVNGTLVNKSRLRDYLTYYQTSSPSYLLMAGIDYCMDLIQSKGDELFENYVTNLKLFYKCSKDFKHIKILSKEIIGSNVFDHDPSKIVISVRNTNMIGTTLYHILLKEFKIQLEMVSSDYVLAMTSIADTKEGFDRLVKALLSIDKKIPDLKYEKCFMPQNIRLDIELKPYEAYNMKGESIPFSKAEGRIAKEYAYLYPPGIPLLVPGERISKECIDLFNHYKDYMLAIKGLKNKDCIQVIKH